jgi:hypothetical protein
MAWKAVLADLTAIQGGIVARVVSGNYTATLNLIASFGGWTKSCLVPR